MLINFESPFTENLPLIFREIISNSFRSKSHFCVCWLQSPIWSKVPISVDPPKLLRIN